QWIDEAQAKFRLESVGKAQPPRNRQIIEKVLSGAKGTGATAPKSSSGLGTRSRLGSPGSTSSNQSIVQRIKQAAGQSGALRTGTTYVGSKASAPQTSVPTWAWVAGGI